jgi:WD40 repeat protein
MGSGISKDIFSSENVLINSIDFDPAGRVMWISDALGGVTHFDMRMDQSKATRYGLSGDKVGSVSVNPTRPHFLLTASNSRALRLSDLSSEFPHGLLTRRLQDMGHAEAGRTL